MQGEEQRIVCLGSATVDVTVKSKSFKTIREKNTDYTAVEQGTKHDADDIVLHCGGSAANIAVVLSRLGMETAIISRVGDDAYADIAINHLKCANVDTAYLKRTVGTRTGTTINLAMEGGEKTLLVSRAALDHLNPQDVPETFVKHSRGVIITSLTSITAANAALKASRIASENHNFLALAPSIAMVREKGRILLNMSKNADMLILNESEICSLMGEKDVKKAMQKAHNQGTKIVAVLRGVRGSMCYADGKFYEHRAYKVKVADTTGAGDAYSAGFIYAHLQGRDISECMDTGAKISAMVVTRPGAQEGIPKLSQLKSFKARFI